MDTQKAKPKKLSEMQFTILEQTTQKRDEKMKTQTEEKATANQEQELNSNKSDNITKPYRTGYSQHASPNI